MVALCHASDIDRVAVARDLYDDVAGARRGCVLAREPDRFGGRGGGNKDMAQGGVAPSAPGWAQTAASKIEGVLEAISRKIA